MRCVCRNRTGRVDGARFVVLIRRKLHAQQRAQRVCHSALCFTDRTFAMAWRACGPCSALFAENRTLGSWFRPRADHRRYSPKVARSRSAPPGVAAFRQSPPTNAQSRRRRRERPIPAESAEAGTLAVRAAASGRFSALDACSVAHSRYATPPVTELRRSGHRWFEIVRGKSDVRVAAPARDRLFRRQ